MNNKKIKMFKLDWGDTPLISGDKKEILAIIETGLDDLMSGDSDGLQYDITIEKMTLKEIEELPECE